MAEKFKTELAVFDRATSRQLFKLMTQGHFEGLTSPLFLGKEANVFTADTKTDTVIVKIYRVATCDFKRMYDYLKYDPRFRTPRSRRRVIFTWAQREYRNLLKAREADVRAPLPITVANNILVMEFIGTDEPAPKLKDKHPKDPAHFLNLILRQISKLYKNGLVHADLSAYNILNHNEQSVIIDWSQATPLENPRAEEYLKRDVHNIAMFFRKVGVEVDEKKVVAKIFKEKAGTS